MSRVLVIGATSLVGSHFFRHSRHHCTAAGRNEPRGSQPDASPFIPLDVSDTRQIDATLSTWEGDVVVNFAGATDVGAIEQQRSTRGHDADSSSAWVLNALAPQRLARACRQAHRRLVALSTDFVFDGASGPYRETDPPASIPASLSWYGWTKAEAERRVLGVDPAAAIVRISYPFRGRFSPKLDFARRFVHWRGEGKMPPLFIDQVITPSWIPDVTRALDYIIDHEGSGVFHVASPELTTPWEFATELFRLLEGRTPSLQTSSAAEAMRKGKTYPRPLKGGLRCDRLPAEGVQLTGWKLALQEFVRELGADAGR